jgi:trigger factor
MNAKLEKLDKNVYKINIEIPAELAATEYNKACRKFSENINIQGFRKGKAPRPLVEKHVGVDRIKQRALDVILPNLLADTISENQLDLVTEPNVESYNFEVGSPVTVTVKFEVKPEVTLPNYKGQTVEVPEYKAGDDAVEKEIESIKINLLALNR